MLLHQANMTALDKALTLAEISAAIAPNCVIHADAATAFTEVIINNPVKLDEFKREYIKTVNCVNDEIYKLKADTNTSLRDLNIAARFMPARLSDFPESIQAASADFFLQKKEGLFIWGKPGTGKTHLTTALIIDHYLRAEYKIIYYNYSFQIIKPRQGYFVSVPDMFLEMRDNFKNGTSEAGIIDNYADDINNKRAFLVLDDLGAEKSTEWVQQTLFTMIDRRYRNMQRTIITSNSSLREIATQVGDRIASRISGMCKIIHLTGNDKRL